MDPDENKYVNAPEFNVFIKDVWRKHQALLVREMISVSKDNIKAIRLASKFGFGFNTRPILDKMPVLVLHIENKLVYKKDKSDFGGVDVLKIKINATGKSIPES